MQRELDRLRVELDKLRESRRKLVLAADADRRAIERDLHDGVHQHLIALAVSLQLAGQAERADPAALGALLDDMSSALQDALDETAELAQRIHPATLEAGDLAALLRSAATQAGVLAAVEVSAGPSYPPELVLTIHLCWLETLARAGRESRPTIDVRDTGDALMFEITETGVQSGTGFDSVRERVEALGGRLTITPAGHGETVVTGSFPLER